VHERVNGGNRIYYVQVPTSGPVVLGSLEKTDDSGVNAAFAGFSLPVPAPGNYMFTSSPGGASTSAALSNGALRLLPWVVTQRIPIDRIGAEVTVIGDVGSKLRLGIYADNGFSYPGALLLDGGQIAGDSATVQDAPAVSLVLNPGLYWIGGAVQAVTTTQPTVRVPSNWAPPLAISTGPVMPTANQTAIGYQMTGVTGALPANFSGSLSPSGAAPRCHVRVAG